MQTVQEAFDRVAVHLATQGATSRDADGAGALRGKMGMKCGVGCLMDDDLYIPEFEASALPNVSYDDWVAGCAELLGLPPAFVKRVSEIHDERHVYEWRDQLWLLAQKFGLRAQILKGLQWLSREEVRSCGVCGMQGGDRWFEESLDICLVCHGEI